MSNLIKKNILSVGLKNEKDIATYEFEFNSGRDSSEIDYIIPDCGACTSARVEGNKIIAELDLSKAQTEYIKSQTPITKTIKIYLNPEEKTYIGNPDTKLRQPNPKKKLERLNLSAIVVRN